MSGAGRPFRHEGSDRGADSMFRFAVVRTLVNESSDFVVIIPTTVADENKRDNERIDLLGTLQGEVMVFQHTTVRQISRGGMQVETTFPMQLDSLHDFRLTLGDKSVVVKGRVAHSKISEFDQDGVVYRSGIEFIDPPERVATAIKEFVETLRGVRAQ